MGGGGLSPGTTQFFRCLGQSLRWHSRLQYLTSLHRAQGLSLIYKGAFAPAPMFSFARRPQASQRSLGQPWLFILLSVYDACDRFALAAFGTRRLWRRTGVLWRCACYLERKTGPRSVP